MKLVANAIPWEKKNRRAKCGIRKIVQCNRLTTNSNHRFSFFLSKKILSGEKMFVLLHRF